MFTLCDTDIDTGEDFPHRVVLIDSREDSGAEAVLPGGEGGVGGCSARRVVTRRTVIDDIYIERKVSDRYETG